MANVPKLTMVGRPAELDVLRSAIGEVGAGSGRVVLIEGEPGIGKSRLVREAISLASAAGMRVALGFAIRLAAHVPYAAWVDALRHVARDEALGSLFEPLGPDMQVLRALVPEIEARSRSVVAARAGFEPAATIRSFRRAIEALASDRPMLVVLEDIQWLDPSSIDLLAIVTRRPPPGLVVLASVRDAHLPSAVDVLRTTLITRPEVDHIRLSPLTRAEARDLVSQVSAGLDARAIEGIVDRAGGNPLFLQELAATSKADEIPETVAAAVRERLRTSSPEARLVLRVTAVAASSGEAVSVSVIREASAQPETTFLAALHELVDAGVLTPSQDNVAFRHALLADAVTAELLLPERRALHGRVAAALDATDRDWQSEPALAGRRAQHWSEAGVPERALVASLDAAATARQARAPRETLRHLERALLEWDRVEPSLRPGSPDLAEILSMASEAAVATGERRAISLVERAIALVDQDHEPERLAALYQLLWSHRWHFGEGRLAGESIERARTLGGSVGGATEASSLATEARALMLDSRHREALEPAARAMRLAADAGDRTTFVGAAITHGVARGFLGQPEQGLDQLQTARRDALDMGDPLLLTRTHVNGSELLCLMGRFEEASDDALGGVQTLRDLGAFGYSDIVMTSRIRALVRLGRWAEADNLLESHDAPEEGNAAVERSIYRAEIALGRGRFDEAESALSEGRRRSVATTGGEYDAQLSDLEIRLALEHGRPHEATPFADAALTRLARWEIPYAVAPVVASGLRAMAEMAEPVDGAQGSSVNGAIAIDALRYLRLHATTSPVERSWLAQAEAELATAERRATADMWTGVADGWEAIGALPLALRPLRRAAETVLATGRRHAAAEPLRRGLRIAESLDGPIELVRLRDLARRARLIETNRPRAVVVPGIAETITERELDVLELLGAGLTNREVGRRLFMSEHTVAAHVSHLLAKLGARSRAEVVANAARLGLLK
jgi:DNA-binding CsgD family transcriptional regulator